MGLQSPVPGTIPDNPSQEAQIADLKHRVKELEALHWITQAVTFSMPLDDILELIYTQLKRVIPLPNFYIAMLNPDRQSLNCAFYAEGDERIDQKEPWPLNSGLSGVIMRNRTPLRTLSYDDECHRRNIPNEEKTNEAWMGAPLLGGNQAIGVMATFSGDSNITYTQEAEDFFISVAAYLGSVLERQRLYDRLQTRARQLNLLNEIGRVLASSLDLDEVLDLVVRNAATLLDSEAGSLLLLDEDSGDLVFRVSSGPTGQKLIGRKVPSGRGIAGVTFSENHPIIVNDAQHDQRWYSTFDQKSEFITRSLAAVPLNARGRTIGVLEVLNHKENRPYETEDVELLTSFAAQAAITIENARLFTMTDQALRSHIEELTTLQMIDRQLNTTLDYREVIGQTLAWAVRSTGATIGLVAVLSEEEDGSRGLRILASHNYPESFIEEYEEKLWPLSQGIMGRAIRESQASEVTNLSADPDYLAVVPDMRAKLTVPIQRENQVSGVITLESPREDEFGDKEKAFIERLADHAAIAIENARLFQAVKQANQAKTDFISFVAHELKQPMTSMKGYTDLLLKGVGGVISDTQQQFLQVIRTNVGRMDEMINELLDVSRIESGKMRLNIGPVQPVDVLSDVLRNFEQVVASKNQKLKVEIEPDLPSVNGDPGRLLQVISNLVSNAYKYTPEGGTITLSVKRIEENGHPFICWSVRDTGVGMTPEELDRLFTKYFRSTNPAVRNVPGTGLGLVITRSIVLLHGGQMNVESESGKGSTFSFTIPVAS